MADLRKFLDQAGVSTLWGKIKAADEVNLQAAKTYADGLKQEIVGSYATKAELEAEANRAAAAEALKLDKTVYDEKIATLDAIDTDHKARIEKMETFWKAAQADGDENNVIDTLKEIQDYIASDETGAAAMAASIQANTKAIDAIEEDLQLHYLTSDYIDDNFVSKKQFTETVGTLATKEEFNNLKGYAESWIDELSNNKADKNALKALAYKDKVAEADLENALATKINGKADASSLGALASKNSVATDDIVNKAVTAEKLADDVRNTLASSLRAVGVRNDENGNHIFYTLTNSATNEDKRDFWTVPVLTAAEIEAICV